MVINPELDDLDLGSVIDAVKRASDNELAKLTEISLKLDGAPVQSGVPVVKAELDAKKLESAVKSGVESATVEVKQKRRKNNRNRRVVASRDDRINEVSLQPNAPLPAQYVSSRPEQINRIADNPVPEQVQSPPAGKDKSNNAIQSVASDVSIENPIDSLEDMPDKVEQAVKDGLSGFDGYWKDARGSVRRSDGKYASKQESKAYNAAEVAQQRQQEQANESAEKQAGVFAQFTTTLKEFTASQAKASLEDDSDATDAAGAAAGGSFFYSAKEMYNLSRSTKEVFDETKGNITEAKGKMAGVRDSLATTKVGKLLGVKSSGGDSEVATISDDVSQTENIHRTSETQKNLEQPVTGVVRETPSVERKPIASAEHTSTQELASNTDVQKLVSNTDNQKLVSNADSQKLVSNTISDSASNKQVTQSQIATQISSTSQIDKAKDAQYKSEHLEVLREQDSAHKVMIDDILDKLDEIKKEVANSASGGGGGLMDLAGDLFDRKGRKGRRGRAGQGGKSGRIRSIFSRGSSAGAGAGGRGVASKGMSMASGAFKGLSKIGGIAGKAIPFLAPALMAYDAFSGFTDTEKHKETFNLKDGQEATTGQKSSMALASVLDMGGLVSGGAGLLGGALGALGFEGAQEALTFDSGDMARGIYGMFGGETPKPQKTAEQVKEEKAKEQAYKDNATDYIQKDHVKRESMEQEADPYHLTTDRVKARSEETGKSFSQTYQEMSREREKQEVERAKVADEMGIDISGNVSHPDLGTIYSPQKKGDQLKIVDQEISRRREVDAMAKDGDFSNGRFIAPQPKGFMDSLNTNIALKQQENTKQKGQGEPPLDVLSEVSEAPPTMGAAESVVRRNERVSEIKAQQADKAFREGERPSKVKIDDESIKKIALANNGGSSSGGGGGWFGGGGSGGGNVSTAAHTERGSKIKAANSPARSTGSIPNNFNDRSLQRQSADLE